MTADLALATIAIARRYIGRQEGAIPNRGPLVDEWLAFVGIHPAPGEAGSPWCSAFACWIALQAAKQVGVGLTFRKSAGALRLLSLNADLVIAEPEPGALAIWDHGGGKGHVGIVTGTIVESQDGAETLASVIAIAGNTNAAGSRDADSVFERGFAMPDARIAGYVRLG